LMIKWRREDNSTETTWKIRILEFRYCFSRIICYMSYGLKIITVWWLADKLESSAICQGTEIKKQAFKQFFLPENI
jgi:hypothetical protein